MKTALVSPCFLEGLDPQGSYRLSRNVRYLDYYLKLKDNLRFDDIWLFDNASSYEKIHDLKTAFYAQPINVFRFPERLERTDGPYGYGYCWRAVGALMILMSLGYEKIYMIDSDGFVLSQKLVDYMNSCETGWRTVWCKKWNFPESSFQIICKDSYPLFKSFIGKNPLDHLGKCMEEILPFTHVEKDFDSDRYGEDRTPQREGMDFYSQAPTNIQIRFEK